MNKKSIEDYKKEIKERMNSPNKDPRKKITDKELRAKLPATYEEIKELSEKSLRRRFRRMKGVHSFLVGKKSGKIGKVRLTEYIKPNMLQRKIWYDKNKPIKLANYMLKNVFRIKLSPKLSMDVKIAITRYIKGKNLPEKTIKKIRKQYKKGMSDDPQPKDEETRENRIIPPSYVEVRGVKTKSSFESNFSKERISRIASNLAHKINRKFDERPLTRENAPHIMIVDSMKQAVGEERGEKAMAYVGIKIPPSWPAILINRKSIDKRINKFSKEEGWTKKETVEWFLAHELAHAWQDINGILDKGTIEKEGGSVDIANKVTGNKFESIYLTMREIKD